MAWRPRAFFTPRDLAEAVGVSESSLKRWADEGAIKATRTAGGHRRIALADAVRFIRDSRLHVARPEVLGLDEVVDVAPEMGPNAADVLFEAFTRDDWRVARGLIVSSYLSGESVAAVCDGPVREALRRAGELWRHSQDGIVVEHRAVDTCLQALGMVRSMIRAVPRGAPIALGGAIAGDPYLLPSLMAATVLADLGFRDVNLGPDVPADALAGAIERYAPLLVWRTVSPEVEHEVLRRDLGALLERTGPRQASLVLGGRGIPAGTATLPHDVHLLGSMGELAGFARGMLAARAERDGEIRR